MMRLAGRSAVVTGGASGIGRATVELFAQEGARVLSVDRPGAEHSKSPGVFAFEQDLLEEQAPRVIREKTEELFDGLDILHANAGIGGFRRIERLEEPEWDRMFDINVRAAYRLTRGLLPLIGRSSFPRMIYTSSLAAIHVADGLVAYAASKAGLLGMMRALAWELGPRGICVNAILPGSVVTPMTNAALGQEDIAKQWSDKIPLRRLAQPVDIARVALFLASDDGGYVTGQPLVVDGGQSLSM
jgi:3-oxoacyl-[acyl-carrier protein] reductase